MGFIVYLASSLLWSDDALLGALQLQKWLILFALFQWGRTRPGLPLVGAVALTVAVLAVLIFPRHVGGFGNPNFAVEFMLACLPLAFACRWWLILPALVWFGFADAVVQWFALGAFLAAFLAAQRQFALAFIVCLVGFNVAVFYEPVRASVFARIEFLIPTVALWLEQPLFGHGLGSFNYEFPRVYGAAQEFFDIPYSMPLKYYAGAAHNEFAQLAMETGLVGLIFAAWLLWKAEKGGPAWHSVALILCCSLVAFPLQNPASAAVFAVCLGYCVPACSPGFWSLSPYKRERTNTSLQAS